MKSRANDKKNFTRGKGLLEPLLARWRARKANQLIPTSLRAGRILDIGCGSFPYFLSHTSFKEKYAIDQIDLTTIGGSEIQLFTIDLEAEASLPFEEEHFEVVTMLAVVEHMDPNAMVSLFQEIHRVLKPGGVLIITTPSAWSAPLLNFMARISLVSKEEIDEHVYVYTLPLLGWYFGRSHFDMEKIRFGYFEFFLNMWAIAEK
jgi:SAM-dependent methyltransferase